MAKHRTPTVKQATRQELVCHALHVIRHAPGYSRPQRRSAERDMHRTPTEDIRRVVASWKCDGSCLR